MRRARIPNDVYLTKAALTRTLAAKAQRIQGVVLEPCSGEDDIVKVLKASPYIEDIITNDFDQEMPSQHHYDATEHELFQKFDFDWVVSNVPFSQAHKILPLAFQYANHGVAMLLRLSYMEPTMTRNRRGEWLQDSRDCMTQCIVFGDPRPHYRLDTNNTDSVTTAWFVWDKRWSWTRMGITPPFDFVTGWSIQGDLHDET